MLTVAYRGNFQPGVPNPWSTETHVTAALEALGHRVVRLQENTASWSACDAVGKEADVFLWQRTWDIDSEGGHRALEHLKAAGVPTVSFHLDLYIGLEREAQLKTDPFWRTEFVFTADGGHPDEFEAYGINHHWLPPAIAAEELGQGVPDRRRFPHPVVFVGSHPYPHPAWRPYRDRLIQALQRRYRRDFTVWPQHRRPIRGKDLASLYASAAVVVGDSCLAGQVPGYWSDRIPETLGRGGLLIHPEVPGLDGWYRDGQELRTYPVGDFDELISLVDECLTDPAGCHEVAQRGMATVAGRDTYRHRMQAVLNILEAAGRLPRLVSG